jgi:hypothetical protein
MSVLLPAFMTPNTPMLMRGTSLPLAGPAGIWPAAAGGCCRCGWVCALSGLLLLV